MATMAAMGEMWPEPFSMLSAMEELTQQLPILSQER